MSYTALYRKFRPDNFEEVRGQDHIITTLKNQINTGRLGHAYLFCGTRGTGKTSVAKIFAKAVNCEHPVGANPCGECPTCKAIASGSSINVIEMDAASNRKIEDIRQVIEEVAYPPVAGKYKVYIVDEVHMLTEQASNALLKTLEEPPEYVIFILATTDPQKLLNTILSRCQRYDFRRINLEVITGRLAEVLGEEGIEAEEKALRYVAKCADGSMRDALSLLDQCVAFHFGKKLTYDMTLDVLGAVDTDVYGQMLRAIMQKDMVSALAKLEEIVILGRDLVYFVDDFTWYLRNLLLVKSNADMEELIDMSSENLAVLKEQAADLPRDTLLRYIYIFCELSNRVKYEAQKRVLIEIELIRMCNPKMDRDVNALTQRMDEIEEGIRNASYISPQEGRVASAAGREEILKATSAPKPVYEQAVSEDLAAVVQEWDQIKKGFGGFASTVVQESSLKTTDGQTLTVVFHTVMGDAATDGEKNEIAEAIRNYMKKNVEVRFCSEREQSEALRNAGDLREMDFTQFGNLKVETEE